jgi:xanthine dehydrogenase accessory factor
VFEVALTVAACLRSGTRADIAWAVQSEGVSIDDWTEAVVFTPGGGRVGSLLGGSLDAALADHAGRGDHGRLITIEITDINAGVVGLRSSGSVKCLLAPATQLPTEVWDLAMRRMPIRVVAHIEGDQIVDFELEDTSNGTSPIEISGSTVLADRIVTTFRPVPQLVVVGDTPVAHALGELAAVVGWRARIVADASTASGLIAGLSQIDKVVVTAHDLDLAGAALLAALESDTGYIGSMGARKMQENRADWLAYRGVTDLTRVHGPAGLDIGANTPGEIAVSIVAEAIARGS